MASRLDLARKFLETQLNARNDIIGAWVEGSVARGEETAASDVDLVLVVTGENKLPPNSRGRIDMWLEDTYVDALLVERKEYLNPEDVLVNPLRATQLKDAIILYDPTNHFGSLQQIVQTQFLQPQWLRQRMHFWVEYARTEIDGMAVAIRQDEPLGICQHPGKIGMALASLPLLCLGITPSSVRSPMKLRALSNPYGDQILDFQGANRLRDAQVHALMPLFSAWVALIDVAKWGHLGESFIPRATTMLQNGYYQDAVHLMWVAVSHIAADCGANEGTRSPAILLAQQWLKEANWHDEAFLATRVQAARLLLQVGEELIAELA